MAHLASIRSQKSPHLCYHPQMNSLWSVWYCVMVLAFQIYIVANSIQRFTRYITLPWPATDQPYLELNAYVGFVGAAVVLMPFFMAAGMLKIGNYSNDGYKRGSEITHESVYQNVNTRKCGKWLKMMWQHGGPTAPFIHVASAFCLLIPKVFIQSQLIKHGFLAKGDIWKTDLDFVMTHKDRLIVLSFLSAINETELWTKESADARANPEVHLEESFPISSEFLNYAIALMVYGVRYPSVFWQGSKHFGLLFSVQLFINGVQQLLFFTGFAVLYKVHVFGPKDSLLRVSPFLLSIPTSVFLFLTYNVGITLSSSVLYVYGAQKQREWTEWCFQRHHVMWKKEAWCLWGYVPHASAFLTLLFLGSTAAPLTHDLILVYWGSLDGAVLIAVVGTVLHLFLWILLWLVLTVKHRWRFIVIESNVDSSSCNGHVSKGMGESEMKFRGSKEAPLLIVDSGQTYQIRENSSKKAIMNLVQRMPQKQPVTADEEDVYWLKPKPPSPKDSDRLTWLKNQKKSPKHKVTFDDALVGSSSRKNRTPTKSPKYGKSRKQTVKFEDFSESDDGDYATLKGREEEDATKNLCPLGGADVPEYGMIPGRIEAFVHETRQPGSSEDYPEDHSLGKQSPSNSDSSKTADKSDSSSGIHSCSTLRESSTESSKTWQNRSPLQRAPSCGAIYYDPRDTTMLIWRNKWSDREQFSTRSNMTSFMEPTPKPFPSSSSRYHTFSHYTTPQALLAARLRMGQRRFPLRFSGPEN